jgi:hypothetical protein
VPDADPAPVIFTGLVAPKLGTGRSVAPVGLCVTAAVSVTFPVNPPLGVTVIVVLFAVVAPGANDKLAAPGINVKVAVVAAPVETTRLTGDPDAALLPAGGLWLMTLPAATVALDAVVTVPKVNPATVIALVAAAWVSPTTLGTVINAAVTVTVFAPIALLYVDELFASGV